MEKEKNMTSDYNQLLTMWREEKKKRQEAQGELTIIKGINFSSDKQKEINTLKDQLKEAREINKLHQELNGKLRKEHIEEIEKVKKEADQLMINKIIKYEKQIKQLKKDAKEMLNYP